MLIRDFVLEAVLVFLMAKTRRGEVTAVHQASIFIGVAGVVVTGGSNIVLMTRNDQV